MLKGNTVIIRPAREGDLPAYLEAINNPQSYGQFLPDHMVSEVKLRQDFHSNGFISESFERYLMTDLSDRLVGTIWVFRSISYYDALEVGYQVFYPVDRGQGLATEATALMCDYLFRNRQVNRLEIRVATENTPSARIPEKTGFTFEGVNRQATFSQGKMLDMQVYSLLRSEWVPIIGDQAIE